MAPRDCRIPRLKAEPCPPFAFRRYRIDEPYFLTIASVPSLEPSSTTRISIGAGTCSRALSTARAIYAAWLNVSITTDIGSTGPRVDDVGLTVVAIFPPLASALRFERRRDKSVHPERSQSG